MKKLFAILAFVLAASPVMAGERSQQPCYSTFYQTHNMDCIDELVAITNTLTSGAAGSETANHQPIVGFFAEFFAAYPQEKDRFTKRVETAYSQHLCLEALFRAGLAEDARQFAALHNLNEIASRYAAWNIPTVRKVEPKSLPAENDLLIGAYLASGNTDFIKKILGNYTSADDDMVSDALRSSFMHSKFGAKLTPQGRKTVMPQSLCIKYKCKEDPKKFMRVMTLSTAHWALSSLAAKDAGIKKTVIEFFNSDERLKKLFMAEHAAFGNYVTMLAVYAAIKESKEMDAALTVFETLGTQQQFSDAVFKAKKKE
jgi:hypothetical protein